MNLHIFIANISVPHPQWFAPLSPGSTYPVSRAPNSRIPKSPRESVSRLSLPLNKNLSRRNGWPIRSYCPEIPPIAFPGFHSPRLSRFTRPHYFCGSRNGIRLERATLKGEPSGYRFIGTARKVLKNNRTQPVPLCSRRNHARLAVCMQMRPPPPPRRDRDEPRRTVCFA